MPISAFPENFETEYLPGLIRIKIPGKKNTQQLNSLSAWLLFWLLVLALILTICYQMTLGIFREKSFNCFSLFMFIPMLFSILIWGTWGVMGASVFFWQVAGLETIEVSRDVLRIRKTIFGVGRTKEYAKDKIISVSFGSETLMAFAFLKYKSAQFQVPMFGPIFVNLKGPKRDYAEHLGLGLEQEQAKKIAGILQQQLFPTKPDTSAQLTTPAAGETV